MSALKRCSICATTARVRHFNLVVQAVVGGRTTSRGAGAIDLCPRCWADANKNAGLRKRHARIRPVTAPREPLRLVS